MELRNGYAVPKFEEVLKLVNKRIHINIEVKVPYEK